MIQLKQNQMLTVKVNNLASIKLFQKLMFLIGLEPRDWVDVWLDGGGPLVVKSPTTQGLNRFQFIQYLLVGF